MDVLGQLDALEAWAREGEHHPSEWVARLSALREAYIDERAYAATPALMTMAQVREAEKLPPLAAADPVWIGPPPRQRKTRATAKA